MSREHRGIPQEEINKQFDSSEQEPHDASGGFEADRESNSIDLSHISEEGWRQLEASMRSYRVDEESRQLNWSSEPEVTPTVEVEDPPIEVIEEEVPVINMNSPLAFMQMSSEQRQGLFDMLEKMKQEDHLQPQNIMIGSGQLPKGLGRTLTNETFLGSEKGLEYQTDNFIAAHDAIPDGFRDGGKMQVFDVDANKLSSEGREIIVVDMQKDAFARELIDGAVEYADLYGVHEHHKFALIMEHLVRQRLALKQPGLGDGYKKGEEKLLGDVFKEGQDSCRHNSLLLKKLGEQVDGLNGKIAIVRGNYNSGERSGSHAWNMVEFGGQIYEADVMAFTASHGNKEVSPDYFPFENVTFGMNPAYTYFVPGKGVESHRKGKEIVKGNFEVQDQFLGFDDQLKSYEQLRLRNYQVGTFDRFSSFKNKDMNRKLDYNSPLVLALGYFEAHRNESLSFEQIRDGFVAEYLASNQSGEEPVDRKRAYAETAITRLYMETLHNDGDYVYRGTQESQGFHPHSPHDQDMMQAMALYVDKNPDAQLPFRFASLFESQ